MKKLLFLAFSLLSVYCHAACDPTLQPSYTPRAGIAQSQINSCSWGTVINNDWSIIDSSAAFQATSNIFTATQTFTQPIIIQPNQPLTFFDATTHSLSFQAPNTVTSTNFKLPTGDGTSGQFLKTDGSGNLSFGSAGGGTSSLAVSQNGAVISSPTAVVNFVGPPFSVSLVSGNTAQVTLDASSVTLQGNTFNQASKLVQLDASSRLPVVDGSQLTNLPSVSGAQIYPATATPSFPFGLSASTAVYSGDVNVGGNSNVRAGKRLQVFGSGDVVASTITNPAASLSQLQVSAANGVGINQSPVNGIDLVLSTMSVSSATITTVNVNSIKYSNGSIQVSSPSASGSTSPGGSNTDIQYNNTGAFGGMSNFTTDGTNLTMASGYFNVGTNYGSDAGTGYLSSKGLWTSDFTLTRSASNDAGQLELFSNGTMSVLDTGSASKNLYIGNFSTYPTIPAIFIRTTSDNVGIFNASPDSSASLDLGNTGPSGFAGFLPPRMTSANRDSISSPVTGLTVFDTTTNNNDFYNGAVWTWPVISTNSLQSGTTFFVSSGTVNTLNVSSIRFPNGTIQVSSPSAGNFIQNNSSLQSGATFYVSSGTAINFNATSVSLSTVTVSSFNVTTALLLNGSYGSSSQVLTSNGPSTLPIWQSIPGGGTVNAGTSGQLGYYATSSNVISGNSQLTATTNDLTFLGDFASFLAKSNTSNPSRLGLIDSTTLLWNYQLLGDGTSFRIRDQIGTNNFLTYNPTTAITTISPTISASSGTINNLTVSSLTVTNPVMSIYNGQNTGTLNGSFNLTSYPTKIQDVNGNYNGSTFTVPTAGYYYIDATTEISGTAGAGGAIQFSVYKNNVEICQAISRVDAALVGSNFPAHVNCVTKGNVGDTLAIWVNSSFTSPAYINAPPNQVLSIFKIF